MRNIFVSASAIFLASPGIYFVFKYAETLNTFEKISAIVFPVVLGFAFYFISSWSTQRALENERTHIVGKIDQLIEEYQSNRIKSYSSKKSVPDGSEYWNNLAREAQRRLIIIGTTNKSWFNKDGDQSRRLVDEFARIGKNGGSVNVISLGRAANTKIMKSFVSNFCAQYTQPNKPLFEYKTIKSLKYSVIFNDHKIVMMPLPYEDSFRDETMVIEVLASEAPSIFQNYMSDIERLLEKAATVDIWKP